MARLLFVLLLIALALGCSDGGKAHDDSCGNFVIDEGEQCDDGNRDAGDGCSPGCRLETPCGNGVIDTGEECDDGNYLGGDGCSGDCRFEVACGNGRVEPGEACDDGNTEDGDGCAASCALEGAVCGNSRVESGEECDGGGLCDDACHAVVCGNGRVDTGEECDGGPGCDADCTSIVCGDGVVEGAEECDHGADNGAPNDCGAGCRWDNAPPVLAAVSVVSPGLPDVVIKVAGSDANEEPRLLIAKIRAEYRDSVMPSASVDVNSDGVDDSFEIPLDATAQLSIAGDSFTVSDSRLEVAETLPMVRVVLIDGAGATSEAILARIIFERFTCAACDPSGITEASCDGESHLVCVSCQDASGSALASQYVAECMNEVSRKSSQVSPVCVARTGRGEPLGTCLGTDGAPCMLTGGDGSTLFADWMCAPGFRCDPELGVCTPGGEGVQCTVIIDGHTEYVDDLCAPGFACDTDSGMCIP